MFRFRLIAAAALCAAVGCAKSDPQDAAVQAAAKQVAQTRLLGPDDLQMVSADGTIAIEVIGDTVHMMTPNSKVSVPATYLENVKFADGRLSFAVKGVGAQMFDVGNGATGAVFRPDEVLAFVSVVLDRQNSLEKKP
ncbi:MAG: hypothetical protein K2R93_18005 [Gemmatimonadaceae bacterium]|nr:hypothetical protein [Gemmatimonadaceae bacterium]